MKKEWLSSIGVVIITVVVAIGLILYILGRVIREWFAR
jgi:hypothetical protein